MLTAMSSAMIYSVLPIFMVRDLGLSIASVGVIEGMAEAANSLRQDHFRSSERLDRRRKPLVIFGYTLSAVVKTVFPVAGLRPQCWRPALLIGSARVLSRRPPRCIPGRPYSQEIRGEGFGLRLALAIAGFVVGPLIAIGLMKT